MGVPSQPSLLPPATKLRQGYVFTGVCDSYHGAGEREWWEACMAGGHAWQGACVAGGGHGGGHTWQERWPLLVAVHILMECILVFFYNFVRFSRKQWPK